MTAVHFTSEPGGVPQTPYAVFAYVQQRYDVGMSDITLYRITGGKYDGSDVTAETLASLGIAVPEPITGRA